MSEVKTDSVVNVSGDSDSGIDLSTNDVVAIKTADSERVRVASDGKVGIGSTSPTAALSVHDSVNQSAILRIKNDSSDGCHNALTLESSTSADKNIGIRFKNQSAEKGGIGYVQSDKVAFYNGTSTSNGMTIESNGRIYFQKTAENAQSDGFEFHPSSGIVATGSAAVVGVFNRKTNDGTIVQFRQDNTTEGTITVSGSTVSYNGGHLARWSQATDGNRIDGLVKGTVMTNLDQMAEWTKDGVTEDNEQLNCMAVSSVEGDANVAGVFVNWDDDDTDFTADMNIAMTGDMVIRIASGTTVARGDLLMSAGDGTAKPQGDDIVRSKTIAKVTSTTKSHTYDDGSYLVPCVLMAC